MPKRSVIVDSDDDSPAIPLPKFKKVEKDLVPEVLKERVKQSKNSRTRKSERISELHDDDYYDDLEPSISAESDVQKSPMKGFEAASQNCIEAGLILSKLNESIGKHAASKRSPRKAGTTKAKDIDNADGFVDIQCTPYDVDPSMIAIVDSSVRNTSASEPSNQTSNKKSKKSSVTAKRNDITDIKITPASSVPLSVSEKKGSSMPTALPLRLAITGFKPVDGEASTIEDTLWAVIRSIEGVSSPSKETKAQVITSKNYPADAMCTHVVTPINDKSRSLRILFALARGVPIVSEEFVYACLCSNQWENPRNYRVSFYSHAPLGSPQLLLDGMSIHIAQCSNPEPALVCTLLSTLGSTLADMKSATCVLFGSKEDFIAWYKSQSNLEEILPRFIELLRKNRVVTFKFISDCIESCSLLKPAAGKLHLLSLGDIPSEEE